MSKLKDKSMYLEVTKSPPSAKLYGPYDDVNLMLLRAGNFAGNFNPSRQIHCHSTRLGNVMEIRLTGAQHAVNSTLLKMALLHEAQAGGYVPLQPVTDDYLTLSPKKDVR